MSTRNMVMSIEDAANVYNPAVQKYFLKTIALDEEKFKSFMTFNGGVTDYILKEQSMSGLAEADFDGGENAVIAFDAPVEGFQQTYTQARISIAQSFTWKMWKFGIEKRKLQAVVNELRQAIIRKRERLCQAQVWNAFATSYTDSGLNGSRTITTTGGDGVAYASASHPREDGGPNWNNIVTDKAGNVNLPFSYEAVKAAQRTSALITDPRGNPTGFMPDTLVCVRGSDVSFKAKEILKAISKGEIPGSFNHDGSAVAAFKVIELPQQYATIGGVDRSEYWAMFDSKAIGTESGYQYYESMAPTLDQPNLVYKTKAIEYTAEMVSAMGANDMRAWVFSKGTGAA